MVDLGFPRIRCEMDHCYVLLFHYLHITSLNAINDAAERGVKLGADHLKAVHAQEH